METHPHEGCDESICEEILSSRLVETTLCRDEIYFGCWWRYDIFHKKVTNNIRFES